MSSEQQREIVDALARIAIGTATVADAKLLAAALNIDWREISE